MRGEGRSFAHRARPTVHRSSSMPDSARHLVAKCAASSTRCPVAVLTRFIRMFAI
jgi:hypothetical protein